jgi:hypothetical protein
MDNVTELNICKVYINYLAYAFQVVTEQTYTVQCIKGRLEAFSFRSVTPV